MQENKGAGYSAKGKPCFRITTKINWVQFYYTETSGHKVGNKFIRYLL